MSANIQIIGGGLLGLCTAIALQKRGVRDIRIIEARNGVALETSFANACMQHASLADPWNGPGVGRQLLASLLNPTSPMKLRPHALPAHLTWGLKFLRSANAGQHWRATQSNYYLADASIKLTQEYRQEFQIKDHYQGTGLIKIFRNEQEFIRSNAITKKLQGLGLQARQISPATAVQKEPALAAIEHEIKTALYYPHDYKADAYLFCKALAREIIQQGGQIEIETQAIELIKSGGKITGVHTDKGERIADTTILATGARCFQLLAPLGIKLPVRPVKGYSLTFKKLSGLMPSLPVVDESLHAAITPLGKSLRIAGMAEITGFNTDMRTARLRPLLGLLRKTYPELAQGLNIDDATSWHGFRPVSADGVPFIGKTHLTGLALNTGHGHMGWTLSTGSGALLADILTGAKPVIDPAPYDPLRR